MFTTLSSCFKSKHFAYCSQNVAYLVFRAGIKAQNINDFCLL